MIVLLGITLTLAPAAPAAPLAAPPVAPPAPIAEPEPEPDPQLLKAQRLYREGAARYDLADYEGAIVLWIESAALMTDEWRRARMVYNIAEVHLKAHDQGRDPAHLRAARDLYGRFLADVQRLDHGKETLSTDVANATVTLERISAQLAALEQQASHEHDLLQQVALHTFVPELTPRTRALRGVGIGLTSASVAAFGLLAAGLVLGQRLEDQSGLAALTESERALTLLRGERANHLAISGAVLGASFLAIGIPTLVVGNIRARRERDEARQRLRPALGPERAMLVWEGRF